jgi:Na+-transporting methylmalonyl-CoA/oxaloacetate decarboxylase gamma subunit
MSDATGKVVFSMFLNGITHAILPWAGFMAYMNLSQNPELVSMTAFLSVLVFIAIGSFFMNWLTLTIVQSSVCGKVFQMEHLASLAGIGVVFSLLFFSLSWHVDFMSDMIRNLMQEPAEDGAEKHISQTVESAVHSFYMFWAGMYSAASLSWFAAACPAPAV